MTFKEIRNYILAILFGAFLAGLGYFVYDYTYVRIAAAKGEAAFNFIQQQIAASQPKQQPTQAPPAAISPPPEAKK